VQSSAAAATLGRLFVSGTGAGAQTSSPDCAIISGCNFTVRKTTTTDPMSDSMMLETPRLILRPFTIEDLDRLAQLMANKDFMRFSMGPLTREKVQDFLDKVMGWDRDGLPSQFAMIIRSNGALVGYCGFFHHEVDGKMEIEIGYRLDSNFWNRGLTTEAARAVRDHGFRDLKLDYVISLIHPENVRSRRVAEKNGMMLERETTFRGFPTFVFSINRQRWLELEPDAG
jgi:ribosomal-protein-alanine N-acetyltransferase